MSASPARSGGADADHNAPPLACMRYGHIGLWPCRLPMPWIERPLGGRRMRGGGRPVPHTACVSACPELAPSARAARNPYIILRRSTVTDRVIQLYSNLNLMLIRKRMVEFRGRRSHSSPPCLIQKRCPLRTSLLTRIRSEWLYRPLGRPPLTLTRLTPSVRYSRTCRRAAAQTISDNDKNCMPSPSRAQDDERHSCLCHASISH